MVNAAGTLYDGTLSNDVSNEKSWDGVWAGRARVDTQGWCAEMRIPYSQMRIERAKRDWAEMRMGSVPGDDEYIPLPTN